MPSGTAKTAALGFNLLRKSPLNTFLYIFPILCYIKYDSNLSKELYITLI